jgi:TRAP-type mannitol/chloroaromatic compound transport system permease small subunit
MWDWLTSRPSTDDVINGFSITAAVIFGVFFLLAAIYAARPHTPPLGRAHSRRFLQRAGMVLGWIAGIGLFFLLIRMLQINPATLGLPFWTVLTLIALGVALVVILLESGKDRAAKALHRAGHRPAQLQRRPVRKAHR